MRWSRPASALATGSQRRTLSSRALETSRRRAGTARTRRASQRERRSSSITRISPTRWKKRSRTLRPLTTGKLDRRVRLRRRPRYRQAPDHGRNCGAPRRSVDRHRRQSAQRRAGAHPRAPFSKARAPRAPYREIGDRARGDHRGHRHAGDGRYSAGRRQRP